MMTSDTECDASAESERQLVKLGCGQYINFGKYKGKSIVEIFNLHQGPGYLQWLLAKDILNDETRWCVSMCFSLCTNSNYGKHHIVEVKPGPGVNDYEAYCSLCNQPVFRIEYDFCPWCSHSTRKSYLQKYKSCYRQ